ncbi:N-acetylglucosamine-1-phosphodiester alpha-N-acetylglucosaminidase [Geodia barretti]|uniref:N-acetylglucosamine-1-phosphodiester alpha-N-acetylglucosaminidase n=1 Tax=Geodia barretti TaxID=519541 RepID=A0AA35WMM4_GEOBA|nr:N-acetylglucosamine-1-phosphodiester alpha-N-acetylglucosaminidase [Geodia barretti]
MVMSGGVLLPCIRCSLSQILLPLLPLLLFLSYAVTHPPRPRTASRDIFPFDYLSPYPPGTHGSRRTIRDISNCLHTTWNNRTFETFHVSTQPPVSEEVTYHLHKFADVTDRPLGPKYLVGTIAYVEEPYHTFSVLEPGGEGSCSKLYGAARKTVGDTTATRKGGCKLAANGGFFVVVSGQCLGNIVSDGRVVRTTNNEQNANFGIREDGSIVVGYIPDEEILNTTNPFRQLVTGVVWLVRNGTNYVDESKKMECADHEDTGHMDTFVEVMSARSALGHDAQGRLVMAQIEGQTHRRGANLVEFADLLIRHGVVNAVNLDGGGSSTLMEDGVLINYPSDHCVGNGQYRCPRAVSTALCVHDVQCLDPECRGHGKCEGTECMCHSPWTGGVCETLNCSNTDCTGHGNCSDGVCECDEGWTGELCEKACPSNRYGQDCRQYCWCFGNSHCHPTTGHCVCPPGFSGYTCMDAFAPFVQLLLDWCQCVLLISVQ